MRLLVTGAAGMLGRDVVLAARVHGHDVVPLGRDALDVTDAAAVRATVQAHRPEAVVNCAAWTDVDGAEEHEDEATAVNAMGAGNVARAAAEAGAALVHVSSDYVFDGHKGEPYVEADAPAPLSAYGRSKLAGERAVLDKHPEAVVVRSSWLFGAGGRNFVETMLALAAERGEVSVVVDQVGCPTWTGHLGPALVEVATGGRAGVLHVAAAGHCSWHRFAVEIFRAAGVACRVVATTTDRFPRPAPRPTFSALDSERADAPRLASWQEGLAGYLSSRETVHEADAAGTRRT